MTTLASAFVEIRPDTSGFSTRLKAELQKIRQAVAVNANMDSKGFDTAYAMISKRIKELDSSSPVVRVDADIKAALTKITEIARNHDSTINVSADTQAAFAQIGLAAQNRDTKITADADTTAASTKLDVAARDRTAHINADTSGFAGGIAAAVAAAAPLIGPLLAPAIAGVGALGSSALVGGGAVASLAASVVGNVKAVGALKTAQAAAATAANTYASAQNSVASADAGLKSAQQAVAAAQVTASQNVASAQNAVATAQITASRNVAAAQQGVASAQVQSAAGVKTAEQQLTAAQQGALTAQNSLNLARVSANQYLKSLEDTLRGTALGEKGARLAVEQAAQSLRQLQGSPTATSLQIQQAQLGLQQAKLARDEAITANNQAIKDAATARKNGVSGSDQVVAAKQQLAAANQGVTASQNNVTQAQAQGAQTVAAAEQKLAQAKADGRRSVAAAEKNVTQVRVAGARAVASAQTQVANAQRSVAAAQRQLSVATTANSVAQKALNKAQQAISPAAAKEFTQALNGAQKAFGEFLKATSGPTLGLVSKVFGVFGDVIKRFAPVSNAAAHAVGGLVDGFAKFTQGRPLFDRLLNAFAKFGPMFIRNFGGGIGQLLKGFIRLLLDFGPTGAKMMRSFDGMAHSFAQWTIGFGRSKTFQDFIAFAKKNAPLVGSILGGLLDIIGKVAVGLAPLGTLLLKTIAPLIQGISKLPTPILLALVGAIGALVATAASGAAATVGLVVAVVSLGTLLMKFKPFRQAVKDLGDALVKLVDAVRKNWPAIERVVKPVLDVVVGYITDALHVITDIIHVFTDIVSGRWSKFWKDLGQLVKDGLKLFYDYITFELRIIIAVFKAAGPTILKGLKALWDDISKVFSDGWKGVTSGVSTAWDWIEKKVSSAGGAVKTLLGHLWGDIKTGATNAWNAIATGIGKAFDAVRKAVGTPIYFVIHTIINDALIGGFNKLAGYLPGNLHINPIPDGGIPHFARGGVMPGYSPGRDTGYAAVGGGEAIMRPEWTKVVGATAINAANKAAREGGEAGVRKFMGAFATGGVVPGSRFYMPVPNRYHPTSYAYPSYPGHTGIDMPAPKNTVVHAIAAGRVIESKDLPPDGRADQGGYGSYGRYVEIDHGALGFKSLYAHFMQRLVAAGQTVRGGDVLGLSGNTGNTYPIGRGYHVHFEKRVGSGDGSPVNPAALLQGLFRTGAHGQNLTPVQLKFLTQGAGAVAGGITGPSLPGFVTNPLSFLTSKISGAMNSPLLRGPFGAMLKGIPGKLISEMASKITGLIGSGVKNFAKGAVAIQSTELDASAAGIWKGLKTSPYNDQQIAGIMGNLQLESGFNPFAIQNGGQSRDPAAAGSGGYGLAQWTPGSKLIPYLFGRQPSVSTELSALLQQLAGSGPSPEGAAGRLLRTAKSPEDATRKFFSGYERGDPSLAHMDARLAAARTIYNTFHSGTHDSGGILANNSFAFNKSGKPEAVLSPRESRAFVALGQAAERGQGGGGVMQIEGKLSIDERGQAWIRGLAREEVNGSRAMHSTIHRMHHQ